MKKTTLETGIKILEYKSFGSYRLKVESKYLNKTFNNKIKQL